jgi:hypothetical protein
LNDKAPESRRQIERLLPPGRRKRKGSRETFIYLSIFFFFFAIDFELVLKMVLRFFKITKFLSFLNFTRKLVEVQEKKLTLPDTLFFLR